MIAVYLSLLVIGVIFFLLHFVAQIRIASLLRIRHPHEWSIITVPEGGGKVGTVRLWMRLQLALRSPVLPTLEDNAVTQWRRIWRYAPWLAWICWFGALALQWSAR